MWPHRVVDPLPLSQLAVEFLHLQRAGRDLIKLLGVSPLGALDRAVELRRSRWQNEQAQAALLAGLLEVVGELGMNWAAVEAVPRVWALLSTQRDTISRAVHCFNLIPGRVRTSKVSTLTMPRGRDTA